MFAYRQKAAKAEPNSVALKMTAASHPKRQPAWTHTLGSQPALALQPKLTINQPGDQYEQEADQVTSQVMRMPTPTVRRCACGGIAGPDGECAACKAKRLGLQRKSDGITHTEAPPSVHQTLTKSGQPLDASTRAFMEPRFGQDFGSVRIHTDSQAAQSADDVSARAYTVGKNIVFGAGQFAPTSNEGQQLLAHELTHTIQQGTNTHSPELQRDLARPPKGAADALQGLNGEQVDQAIAFNEQRFSDPYTITVVRDIIGLPKFPAVVDEDFVNMILQWQAEHRITQDGKIGHLTTRSIFLEMVAEGQFRDAVLLLLDSYAIQTSGFLWNITVGSGPNSCGTAAAPADAITRDVGGGNMRSISVCRASIPTTEGGYDHFVRILLHETVHVPQRTLGPADHDAREFDAYFEETCSAGRLPNLTNAERVIHAGIAINHFNLMGAAFRTPVRVGKKARLDALVAAGGAGAC